MSQPQRPRRVVSSTVNTPTAIHISSVKSIDNSEAERLLTEFITASEVSITTLPGSAADANIDSTSGISNSAGGNVIISQLSRVQRDLRGLPPLAVESFPKPTENSTLNSSDKPALNKKIKFSDSEESEDKSEI
ncbi:RNA polymerase I subunit RPA14-domain-containing protein [Scheffersomyces coipomensis]|uniref:RNA polymerase I subunit RPA14-domain-containing protein n=1 Tax=Scheffersomyces coipomensis TaxID=1788519 RepID=UPI00315CCA13